MQTSTDTTSTATASRAPLRLRLVEPSSPGRIDGAWWPRSRDLRTEAADLVDNFPVGTGRINRLLFSRPDWDDAVVGGRGLHRIDARRGPVKVGSFPSDDTHLMILTMASGQRLRLVVIPSDTDAVEGERRLRAAIPTETAQSSDDGWARWDDESPGT
jgi:uncharacterized protein DUF5994